jgi:hypothetical protein
MYRAGLRSVVGLSHQRDTPDGEPEREIAPVPNLAA